MCRAGATKTDERVERFGVRATALSAHPRLHTVSVALLFHLVYLVVPLSLASVPVILLRCVGWKAALAAPALWLAPTWGLERKLGAPWPAFQNLFLWKYLFSWFPITLERAKDATFSSSKTYVFAAHPHGALAFHRAAFGFDEAHLWAPTFGRSEGGAVDYRVLTASAAFAVPGIREFWLWSRCVDASKPVARGVLRAHTSILVYPGGEREQILTKKGAHVVYLNKRKGFVKLALETDSPLVPMYAFGETDLYDHWGLLLSVRRWLVARFGVAIPLISGSCFLLPHRVPIRIVVGAPIDVARFREQYSDSGGTVNGGLASAVDALHAAYVDALRALFDEHKARCGYPDAELVVV